MPDGTPFTHTKSKYGYEIYFRGRIWLSGTYVYGYREEYSEEGDEPELIFIPDEKSRALLPYWAERGPLEIVQFENYLWALARLVPRDQVISVKSRKVKSVRGIASIKVSQYIATFECDSPVYMVKAVETMKSGTLHAGMDPLERRGC